MVAAARSRRGASFALVEMIPLRRFEVCLSISLYMEWVAVLTRAQNLTPETSVDTTLGFAAACFLCATPGYSLSLATFFA